MIDVHPRRWPLIQVTATVPAMAPQERERIVRALGALGSEGILSLHTDEIEYKVIGGTPPTFRSRLRTKPPR